MYAFHYSLQVEVMVSWNQPVRQLDHWLMHEFARFWFHAAIAYVE